MPPRAAYPLVRRQRCSEMQNDSPIELLAAAVPEFLAIAGAFGQLPAAHANAHSPAGGTPRIQLATNLWLTCTGVGKVNAAIAATRILISWEARTAGAPRTKPPLLASLGIAGALPRPNGPVMDSMMGAASNHAGAQMLDVILAARSCYADEGVQTPDAFINCWIMGFPLGPFPAEGVPGDPALLGMLPTLRTDAWAATSGPIATVSTCSGTDALALSVATRTGAIAEAMEGAAIAHAITLSASTRPAARTALPRFAELRVISNTTGNRDTQVWQIKPALQRLGEAAVVLAEHCITHS